MAQADFVVESYEFILREVQSGGGPAHENLVMLGLFGSTNDGVSRRLILYFAAAGDPLTPPWTSQDCTDGSINVSADFLPLVLDLLRNEKQIKAGMNADPTLNYISAGPLSVSNKTSKYRMPQHTPIT